MKLSKFNVWAVSNKTLILFNTATNALVSFEKQYISQMIRALDNKTIDRIPIEFRADLFKDGFLVDDDTDEILSIRQAVDSRKILDQEYFISIVTNFACNFQCTYCYEQITGEKMVKQTETKLETMINKLAKKAKRIEIDWFGGEPLLTFDLVRRLNDRFILICQKESVAYSAAITSNAYLLTKSVVEYCIRSSIGRIMTTIDGPSDLHDQSRPLKKGGRTLTVILENIQYAVSQGLEVTIRVNVSKQNIDRLNEIFEMLENLNLKNKVEILLQPVVSSSANPCEEICLSGSVLAEKVMAAYKSAANRGWIVFPHIDKIRSLGFCIAEYPGRFIIDLQGNLYKCAQLFTDKESVGKIDADGNLVLDPTINAAWVGKDPTRFSECFDCTLLPICMGGCNLKRYWEKNMDYCIDIKYDLPGFLEVMVINQSNLEKLVHSH